MNLFSPIALLFFQLLSFVMLHDGRRRSPARQLAVAILLLLILGLLPLRQGLDSELLVPVGVRRRAALVAATAHENIVDDAGEDMLPTFLCALNRK